ncbi:hypothetical protein GCM10023189_44580 [Nibrella saemangeumensis]|uniref:HTH cro/C1-type domain-containing protein n=1 Tax=Nibrella saemangeumensis TaxID=1084526 RepID=A0ABP8NC61_9BACT
MGKSTAKNDLGALIGPRFLMLRRHLGERLGENLTLEDLAQKTGLTKNQVFYMERDMSGTSDSLATLLTFYRSHGYNLDWILNPTQGKKLPMVITAGKDLLAIVQQIGGLSKVLQDNYEDLSTKLLELGYQPMENELIAKKTQLTEPANL